MTAEALHRPPSLDKLLDRPVLRALQAQHGRAATLGAARVALDEWRANAAGQPFDVPAFEAACTGRLDAQARLALRPVFNLTGTVLHTNLGRALMPQEAIAAVTALMRDPGNLEYDLASGARGDRDEHIDGLLKELTGAEAATAVNNNAAAVLLVLAALAERDAHQRLNVKAYREATGISRHFSMPLVEFFDHIGFTKRDPVGRKIRRDAREMFGTSP